MHTNTQAVDFRETLKDYAAGAMQKGTRHVSEFLAPVVPVPAPIGVYKKWTEKSRFFIPTTLLAAGGGASEVAVEAQDENYDCEPHGLDYTVEGAMGADVPALVRDGGDFLSDIYGLVHLVETLALAKAAAGAGADLAYDVDVDPVEKIDDQIEAVMLAGKCEQAGVLFGAKAWKRFKNHPAVRTRGPLKWESNPALFTADAQYMGCFSLIDTKPEGEAPVMDFILKDEIVIFGKHPVPNRRDPSFMKTLRLEGAEEKLRVIPTPDGRRYRVKIDWSAQIKVTNPQAVKRINFLAP